mmetsp:Transcript_42740/g.137762  ORF Transcript_42740/g.137762 Transcript_42740/m.137762 type:complete len:86 (+) Transcript_42740:82-339(+)
MSLLKVVWVVASTGTYTLQTSRGIRRRRAWFGVDKVVPRISTADVSFQVCKHSSFGRQLLDGILWIRSLFHGHAGNFNTESILTA